MKLIKTILVTTSMLFAATVFAAKPTISDLQITSFEYSCDTGKLDATAVWTPSGNSGKGVIVAYDLYGYDSAGGFIGSLLYSELPAKMNEGISVLDTTDTTSLQPFEVKLNVVVVNKKEEVLLGPVWSDILECESSAP